MVIAESFKGRKIWSTKDIWTLIKQKQGMRDILHLMQFSHCWNFYPPPAGKVIWCPFDKSWSEYVRILTGAGYKVIWSHIDDGKDFFTYEPEHWDILISNPPFSKKDAVLEKAYSFNKPFALLLPVNTIQGKARFDIFKNEIQLLCFDSRIGFSLNRGEAPVEGTSFGSAYFCRDLLPTKLELRRLDKSVA